jgi:hypothetical protein
MLASYMVMYHSSEPSTTTMPYTNYLLCMIYRDLVINYLAACRKDPIEHRKTSHHCITAPLYQLYHEYLTNFHTLIVSLARRTATPFLASNTYSGARGKSPTVLLRLTSRFLRQPGFLLFFTSML